MSTSDYSTQRLPGTWSARLRAAAAAKPISAEAWIVGGLVMLAAAIRFGTIATQSFWADEALTAYESHLPFGGRSGTDSGIGKVGGAHVMHSFTELQTIVLTPDGRRR